MNKNFKNSASNEWNIQSGFIPIQYYECVSDIKKLQSDSIFKEEAIYLSKVRNLIDYKIYCLENKVGSIDSNNGWTFSPTPEDLKIRQDDIGKRQRGVTELKKLEGCYSEPYFARMDIESYSDKKIKKIYIGQTYLDKDGDYLVYDWRSNIGQRYYIKNELEFMLDNDKYATKLIRKFEIKNSKLYSYDEEYVFNRIRGDKFNSKSYSRKEESNLHNIADPFLIKVLRNKRNQENIGNIISSIQDNQNKIITQGLKNNIIVQGCAGSGKTMILLHRLSYLLFNNRDLELERIKILTANSIFNNSINNLAEELELEKIDKITFEGYLESKIRSYGMSIKGINIDENISDSMYNYIYSDKYLKKLRDAYDEYIESLWKLYRKYELDKLELLYDVNKNIYYGERENRFLNLKRLVELIDFELEKRNKEYSKICEIEKQDIRELKTTLNRKKIYLDKLKELRQLIEENDKLQPTEVLENEIINKQITDIMSYIKFDSANISKIDRIIAAYEKQIEDYDTKMKEKSNIGTNKVLVKYRDNNFRGYRYSQLKDRIKEMIELLDPKINRYDFLETKVYSPLIKKVCKDFNYNGKTLNGRVRLYSLLQLLYIHKGKLTKSDRMLFIDEGQDINKAEYTLINKINEGNVIFNILGDINQCINVHRGIRSWASLLGLKEFQTFKLEENYRNSQQITNYCIRETGYKMISIGLDDGKVVTLEGTSLSYLNMVKEFIADPGKRKAILVKEIDRNVKEFIHTYFKSIKVNLVSDDSFSIDNTDINVLTVKMSKGLEFDSTLVITKGMTKNEEYIALTRALVNSYVINPY